MVAARASKEHDITAKCTPVYSCCSIVLILFIRKYYQAVHFIGSKMLSEVVDEFDLLLFILTWKRRTRCSILYFWSHFASNVALSYWTKLYLRDTKDERLTSSFHYSGRAKLTHTQNILLASRCKRANVHRPNWKIKELENVKMLAAQNRQGHSVLSYSRRPKTRVPLLNFQQRCFTSNAKSISVM